MRLYLVQHGLALPKDADPDRPLSDQGRADVQRLADFLGRAGVHVERILHSGKTRAEQTAETLATALLPAGRPEAHGGLRPNDPVEPVAREIAAWDADTLIAGHLPFLGRLAALLIADDPDRPTLTFQPGSAACLELDANGGWSLVWMLRPELLARTAA
jgi:phosphohistidine phosphatase